MISAESVRSSYYEQYRHEIDAIWRNSTFLWTFEALIFGAYGVLLNSILHQGKIQATESHFTYYLLTGLIFIGMCTSTIWIALAKASKTWQEIYEAQITSLEQNRDYFKLPRKYAMGGSSYRYKSLDSSLFTHNSGKFSPGKINIFISQFVWLVWLFIYIMLQLMPTNLVPNIPNRGYIIILYIVGYILFVIIMLYCVGNKYLRKEDYKEEFILETYVRLESIQGRLDKIKPNDKHSLYGFVINDYCDISYALFKIFEAQGYCNSFDDWLTMPFEQTKSDFCWHYINSGLGDGKLIEPFMNRFKDTLATVGQRLREFYIGES